MKIGLLGGTFDPVHNGHISLAKAALKQLSLDKVYLVLSPLSPFKQKQQISPVPLRLAMLEAAVKGNDHLMPADWETHRKGPSYTVTTLATYKKKHPTHELFLIMGSDALVGFEDWKDSSQILKMATLVIGRRPGTPLEFSNVEGRIVFLKGEFPEISSTNIRFGLTKGRKLTEVPAGVAKFIKENRLYEK